VLIGLNALDMVQARRSQQRETPAETAEGIEKEDIGILPLGVPMLAGPGAISTVMVLALGSKSPITTVALYVSIALTATVSYVTLAAASLVERRLGQTGMRILTRLMGLVLAPSPRNSSSTASSSPASRARDPRPAPRSS
jgi:multiple antibiotic resistance protein